MSGRGRRFSVEDKIIFLVFLIASGVGALFTAMGALAFWVMVSGIALIGGIIGLWVMQRRRMAAEEERKAAEKAHETRRMELTKKWGPNVADNILDAKIWIGMTAEQLAESRGEAEETEQSRYKNTIKETWKYDQFGENCFEKRVLLENQKVVGWKGRWDDEFEAEVEADCSLEAENLDIGSRVKAKWRDGKYYPCIIARVVKTRSGARYDVDFDDGDKIPGLSITELQPIGEEGEEEGEGEQEKEGETKGQEALAEWDAPPPGLSETDQDRWHQGVLDHLDKLKAKAKKPSDVEEI